MKRAFAILFAVLLLLAVLASVAFAGLAASEWGTRALAGQVERLLPLRLAGITGTLWRTVRVERLTLELDRQVVTADALAVDLRLSSLLFDNRLELVAVHAKSVAVVERPEPERDEAPVALALPFLPLDIDLARLQLDRLELPGVAALEVRGAATWTAAGLVVRELSAAGETLQLHGSGTLGAGSRPTLEMAFEWSLPQAGWQGGGTLEGPFDRLEVSQVVAGQYPFELGGFLDLESPARPVMDLTVAVHDVEAEGIVLAAIDGHITGTLDALVVEAAARVDPDQGEPFPVQVIVRGPIRGALPGPLQFELNSAPLGGTVIATGNVDWSEGLAISARGSARGLELESLLELQAGLGSKAAVGPARGNELEPAAERGSEQVLERDPKVAPAPDAPAGQLGADFAIDYRAGAVAIEITDLAGIIDGRSVSGHGRVRGAAGGEWTAEAVELALGDNRAEFSGHWQGSSLAVDGHIAAPALDQLGLGIAGAVEADVNLAGEWPALEGTLEVNGATLAGAGLELVDLTASARFAGGQISGRADAVRLTTGALDLAGLALTVSGALDAFNWRLDWTTGEARGAVRQSAGDLWVDLAALRVELFDEQFATSAPVTVRFVNGTVDIAPVCFAGDAARLCLARLQLEEGRLTTAGVLERLPVALLQRFVPITLDEAGYVEGSWDLARSGDTWTGALDLAGRRLSLADAAAEQPDLELPDVELKGVFAGAGLDVVLRARGEGFGIEGNVRLAPVAVGGQLAGVVAFTIDDLGWLAAFDERVEELAGSLSARVTLSGAVLEPALAGTFETHGAHLVMSDPAFRLDGIELTGRVDPSGLFEVTGAARQERPSDDRGSGDAGAVAFEGRGSGLFGAAFEFDATLHGQGLRATHPQWEGEVAPNLALSWREGVVDLTGTVDLPRAEVRLKTRPTDVASPSADVIVIGRESPTPSSAVNSVRMNVQVRLGNAVRLRALGVEAQLQGDLDVRRDARGQTSVRGTLDVTGGLISAQGQTLAIESGVVVYNGPIDNPYIDVRAVRKIEDQSPPVKVGLHIRGNANRLTSSVFSEPAMAENRALAFLVLGRDIDEDSDTDSGQLVAAAINLGLSQSKSLTGELRRISGLDELSAVAEGQDSFALAAGKRIGENIFLRYTYNTLTAVGAVLVSLDLSEHWRLEATSGENAAMDILYRIDR